MTSSLVGSEMCIRDSNFVRWHHQRPHPSRQDHEIISPLPAEKWPTHQPVSYTHLTLPTICSV
eukprot:859529-Prorocentrum_lima.AAC.1